MSKRIPRRFVAEFNAKRQAYTYLLKVFGALRSNYSIVYQEEQEGEIPLV